PSSLQDGTPEAAGRRSGEPRVENLRTAVAPPTSPNSSPAPARVKERGGAGAIGVNRKRVQGSTAGDDSTPARKPRGIGVARFHENFAAAADRPNSLAAR